MSMMLGVLDFDSSGRIEYEELLSLLYANRREGRQKVVKDLQSEIRAMHKARRDAQLKRMKSGNIEVAMQMEKAQEQKAAPSKKAPSSSLLTRAASFSAQDSLNLRVRKQAEIECAPKESRTLSLRPGSYTWSYLHAVQQVDIVRVV